MSSKTGLNLAIFLDFDNVAIGARDARQRFDIDVVQARLLEKGKIVVKKAYADWSYYKDYMQDLHGAAIELIEVPSPRMSGKNSADIRMVVDAMDLCYSKDHIDAFVIISGDSDFSPLVSKLRENDKTVIGIGLRGSTSELLVSNCDEFIFYDDLVRGPVSVETVNMEGVPGDKKKLFNLVVATIEGLLNDHRGVLHSSLVKDTMKRKKPDFNERLWGYSSFSDLLEEAMHFGLLTIERDERAGGSFVVTKLGGDPAENGAAAAGPRKPSSRRRRRRGKGEERTNGEVKAEQVPSGTGAKDAAPAAAAPQEAPAAAPAVEPAADAPAAKKGAAKKTTAKKTTAKKVASKKAPAKKTAAKKTTAKKAASKKAPAKKTATRKTTAKKAAAKKTTKATASASDAAD